MAENVLDVSVIMPALNEEKNILLAMKNALGAFEECGIAGEIIVINDGSKDRTKEIVEGFLQSDKRVRILNHNKPQGIGASF